VGKSAERVDGAAAVGPAGRRAERTVDEQAPVSRRADCHVQRAAEGGRRAGAVAGRRGRRLQGGERVRRRLCRVPHLSEAAVVRGVRRRGRGRPVARPTAGGRRQGRDTERGPVERQHRGTEPRQLDHFPGLHGSRPVREDVVQILPVADGEIERARPVGGTRAVVVIPCNLEPFFRPLYFGFSSFASFRKRVRRVPAISSGTSDDCPSIPGRPSQSARRRFGGSGPAPLWLRGLPWLETGVQTTTVVPVRE